MGSWVGKIVHSCINTAISDFYAVNNHYKTRIVLHIKNTHGEPLLALSAALDLLEKSKVQAIISSESTVEAKFLALLADQARVPIISLSPSPSSNKHPYFLQITQDETTEFQGIASMAESFGWKNVIIISEDTTNGRHTDAFMTDAFEEKGIHITHRSRIPTSASNELVQEELHKLSSMQTKVFVIHASPSLASHLFLNAKEIRMMDEGYKWIITSKTMNFLGLMDDEVIESIQGAVGFKSYIPKSKDLHKFTNKWRKSYHAKEINAYGIWAYDAISALAMAVEITPSEERDLKFNIKDVEKTGSTQSGTTLLSHMLRISFRGLGGAFQLTDGRISAGVLEVINVIGKGERRVGFWTKEVSFTRKIRNPNSFSNGGLETIIWPGGTTTNPNHRMLQMSGKRLKIGIPVGFRSGRFFQVKHDYQTNLTVVSGFCVDVFLAAFSALDRKVEFDFVPYMLNARVGEVNYNDLIYQVHVGVYDGAIGDITITANRSRYVDFTSTYTDVGVGTLSRNPDKSMWIFMEPLSSDLWLVSAFFCFLTGFIVWILEHQTNEEFQGSPAQQIGTTLWFACSTLVYAHRQKLQSNLSRFVVTVWVFGVLVLTSSYTATLSSLLTVEQI